MYGILKSMDKTISQLIDLSNKTAIVTGGAKGIGLGIVKRLHEAGASVIIADLDAENGQTEALKLNEARENSAIFQATDVSKSSDVEAMVKKAVETFGSLDIMVNNAGIFPFVPLSQLDEALFSKVIDINLKGVFLCSKAASVQMIAQGQGGSIITITSIDAIHPSSVGLAAYDASKHGVWGFLKNIALELCEHNIRVNAIAPGGINTPGVAAQTSGVQDPEALENLNEQFRDAIPMHRLGEPDEIGTAALFLASDLSTYMTGSQVVVDGGKLLR